MTRVELKNKVIGRINQIENDDLLAEVYRLLETGDEKFEIYKLSDQQEKAIDEAEEQIKKGEYISNKQANKDIDEWLNK